MTRERIEDRVAEEAQLLAEEKWVIDALNKVRKQKNGLQIERLQLESLDSKLKEKSGEQNVSQPTKQKTILSPCASVNSYQMPADELPASSEFDLPKVKELPGNIDFDNCNDEVLDLAVSESVFSNEFKQNMMEDFEEDDDDEDTLIDMNMLMNSKNSYKGCNKNNT